MAQDQAHYDGIGSQMIGELFERVHYENHGKGPNLSAHQIVAMKNQWALLVRGDISRCGFDMFMKMFESHPPTKEVFEFARGSASKQMANSSRVMFHVTRVAGYIGKVVENLDCLEDVVPLLKEVGGRHGTKGYNIPKEYIPFLGDSLVACLKADVKGIDRDSEAGWKTLYQWIVTQFHDGMKDYNTGAPAKK